LVDELLERLGFDGSAYEMAWPEANEAVAREAEIVLPVQVNGKLRVRLTVAADADEATIRAAALDSTEVQSHLAGKEPRRVIVVAGRLVNIVV
jgi:leucyl-tRNA synthetase